MILFQINVFAELTLSSCGLLRTANSLTVIIPELAQLAMRFYSASLTNSTEQNRQKRSTSDENLDKTSDSINIKSAVAERMMANTIRDVNFTNIAMLLLKNNETLNKIRKHIDSDTIIRIIMREIDYEKLGRGLLTAAEAEFDLEHFIASIINITRIDVIHDEIFKNGTLPEWLLKNIHPDLNTQTMQKISLTLKNVTSTFVQVLSKSERFDNYLFNMITQQALTPLNNIIQEVKDKKPKTFNQLIEIIINNINKVVMNQFVTTTKQPGKKSSASNGATVDLNYSDDVKLMLYQWSIAVNSMGQTIRIIIKSLEQLYCLSLAE